MTADIMHISRLKMGTDGEGITTLVTLWGCELDCRYCLNACCHDPRSKNLELTADELKDAVKIDDLYFRMSDGGITFGGGEPLLQSGFIAAFCSLVPQEWKIRIETCLNTDWESIASVLRYIDHWYIDLKDTDSEIYLKYTGKDNAAVKENLSRLYALAGPERLTLRIPCIPGFNRREDLERSLKELEAFYCDKEIFTYRV